MKNLLLVFTLSFCCVVVAILIPMFSVEGKLSSSKATTIAVSKKMKNAVDLHHHHAISSVADPFHDLEMDPKSMATYALNGTFQTPSDVRRAKNIADNTGIVVEEVFATEPNLEVTEPTLEVTEQEIKYHPDKNPGNEEFANKEFHKIPDAFEKMLAQVEQYQPLQSERPAAASRPACFNFNEWTGDYDVKHDSGIIPYRVIKGDLIIRSLPPDGGSDILHCITMVTGTIKLIQTLVGSLVLRSLNKAFRIDISVNQLLTHVSFPELTHVSFPAVDPYIYITHNPKLEFVDMPKLTEAGYIRILENPELTSLYMHGLAKATEIISIYLNPKLTSVYTPRLLTAGYINIHSNTALKSLDMSQLSEAEYIRIMGNPELESFYMSGLTTATRGIDIYRNMVDFSQKAKTKKKWYQSKQMNYFKVTFPKLTLKKVGGPVYIYGSELKK